MNQNEEIIKEFSLSPHQEWRLHNGEVEVPKWFIEWTERVALSAKKDRDQEVKDAFGDRSEWEDKIAEGLKAAIPLANKEQKELMERAEAMKSKCCGANVREIGMGDFGDKDDICTMYNECTKCEAPCDVEEEVPADRRYFCKSKCCNAEVKNRFYESQTGTSYGIIQEQSCSQCGEELETIKEDRVIPKDRPAFHVDDKLKEAAKKASEVFEEEEKTEIQRLEERVEKLSGIVEILWNERIDKIQRNVSPDFWSDKF